MVNMIMDNAHELIGLGVGFVLLVIGRYVEKKVDEIEEVEHGKVSG